MKMIGFIIMIAVIASLTFAICPTPKPCQISFEHDPNAINYRVVGSYTMTISQSIVHDFNSCDPDEDNGGFVYELLANPVGMACSVDGKLTWQPSGVGIYYVDVQVTDKPIAGTPGTDTGTIVFRVLPDNRPPILGGCSK